MQGQIPQLSSSIVSNKTSELAGASNKELLKMPRRRNQDQIEAHGHTHHILPQGGLSQKKLIQGI